MTFAFLVLHQILLIHEVLGTVDAIVLTASRQILVVLSSSYSSSVRVLPLQDARRLFEVFVDLVVHSAEVLGLGHSAEVLVFGSVLFSCLWLSHACF